MQIKWVKIWASNQLYEIQIAKAILEENKIAVQIINKQDYAYLFGEIEVYVQQAETIRALFLLRKLISKDET